MDTASTIEQILKDVPRFRILCVGRAGVGKSSLINRVFGITEAKISDYVPGEASIDQEFVSDENKYFVLHDSNGFEPGNNTNFNVAARFLKERDRQPLLKDKLHAIWLCTETPRAGGRVLEEGDKKLLALAYKLGTPVVVVFTKYDLLVRSKQLEEEPEMDTDTDTDMNTYIDEETRKISKANASKAFAASVQSLSNSTATLKIPTPPYIGISIEQGYERSIADLVDTTRKLVHKRLEGDAWVTWAIAQRANIPVKIEACVERGTNFYYHALRATTPGRGNMLLWECLAQIHQDIVTCWNFRDENKILSGMEFQQLMLYLVQDVQSPTASSSIPVIAQFVDLVNTGTLPLAPPVAILGLAYFFIKRVSVTALQRIPEIECLLMAYTIDLVSVLTSLFDLTLRPDLAGTTNWEVLKKAFGAYERRRQNNHAVCRSIYGRNQVLRRDVFRQTIKRLLDESLGLGGGKSELDTRRVV